MKSVIIGLMLIAAVSCAGKQGRKRDVSEVYVAQGWSKGADGYNYDIPTVGLTSEPAKADVAVEVVPEPVYEPEAPQYVEEVVAEVIPEAPVAVAAVAPVAEVQNTVAADVVTVDTDYLPPTEQELREYLPPARRRLRFRRRFRLVKRQ